MLVGDDDFYQQGAFIFIRAWSLFYDLNRSVLLTGPQLQTRSTVLRVFLEQKHGQADKVEYTYTHTHHRAKDYFALPPSGGKELQQL